MCTPYVPRQRLPPASQVTGNRITKLTADEQAWREELLLRQARADALKETLRANERGLWFIVGLVVAVVAKALGYL